MIYFSLDAAPENTLTLSATVHSEKSQIAVSLGAMGISLADVFLTLLVRRLSREVFLVFSLIRHG